ncbi:hypothetical protein, partial [Pseudoalteromonas sp.]|uniref:hypothetical protein n=1 Tax=Pseudoalteromonas sp. TaxID=53249 RepID=UPI002622CAE3
GVGGYTCWSRIRLSARGRVIKDYPYAGYMAHMPMVVGIDSGYLNTVLTSMAAFAVDQAPVNDLSYVVNAGLDYRRATDVSSYACKEFLSYCKTFFQQNTLH